MPDPKIDLSAFDNATSSKDIDLSVFDSLVKKKASSNGLENTGKKSNTGSVASPPNSQINGNQKTLPFQPINTSVPSVLVGKAREQAKAKVQQRKEAAAKQPAPKADGGVGASFMKGLATFNESLAKTPQYLYELAAAPQNFLAQITNTPELLADYDYVAQGKINPLGALDRLGDYYKGQADSYESKIEKFNKGVFDSLKDGDYRAAGKQVLNNIAESAPSIAGMMVTGGIGNAAKASKVTKTLLNALPFASSKNAEIQGNTDMPEYIKPIYSTLHGLSEVVFDQDFGTKAAIDDVIRSFGQEGREIAIDKAKGFVSGYVENAVKKVQPLTTTVKNSLEEMTTTYSQNLIDKLTIDPDKDLFEGIVDAGIVGGVTGGTIKATGMAMNGVFNSKNKQKISEAVARRNDLLNDIDNPNLPEEIKEEFASELEKTNDRIAKLSDEGESKLSTLPEKEQAEALEIQQRIDVLEASLADESISESSKQTIAQQIDKMQDNLDELHETASILEKPDSEDQLFKDSKEAEDNFEKTGDQVEYEQKMKEIEARATLLQQNQPQETTEATEPRFTEKQQFNRERLLADPKNNMVRNLGDYTDKVYREISFDDLGQFLPNDGGLGERDYYVSDSPNLALGQGENNGVKLEFDSDGIQGFADFSKPTMAFTFENGEGEYQTRYTSPQVFKKNLRRIEIAPKPKRKQSSDVRFNRKLDQLVEQGWTLETKEDGTRIYTRPDINAETTPIAATETPVQEVPKTTSSEAPNSPETTSTSEDTNEGVNEPISLENTSVGAVAKGTALKNADIAEKRREMGFEPREAVERQANPDLIAQAKKEIADGSDLYAMMDEIEGGRSIKDNEVVKLKLFQLAKEDEIVDLNIRIEQGTKEGRGSSLDKLIQQRENALNDLERSFNVSERAGTESARALQARRINLLNDYSLAGMLLKRRKANGGAKLTPEQQNEVIEYQKTIKDLEAKLKVAEGRSFDNLAEQAFKKLQRENRNQARTLKKEELNKQIESVKESLLKKVNKQRGTLSANPVPLEAVADIAKLAKLYIQKGALNLQEVVDNIYNDLKDSFNGLEKDHIKQMLAEYNEDSESKEEARLKSYKTRTQASINDFKDRINRKDFSKKTITPIVLDQEGRALKNALIKARFDFEVALHKDKLAKRGAIEKFHDGLVEVGNLPRSIMASADFSAPLRQAIVPTLSNLVWNPKLVGRAFKEMFTQWASQGKADEWLYDLKESPGYELIQKSNLYIADNNNPSALAKEEDFMSNWVEKIPYIGGDGKLTKGRKFPGFVKGSGRAYAAYLNKMRVDLFSQGVQQLQNDGVTFVDNPEAYKALASYINAQTGRGELGALERAAPILNAFFFSPRLMSSRIILLSGYHLWGRNMPKSVRIAYAKDMLTFIAFGTSMLALASLNDEVEVEKDPRSSDFGKIKVGDTRWDIWGGFQQYVRFIAQSATGKTKSTTTGEINKIGDNPNAKIKDKGDLALNFLRSKLAPVPAAAVNFYTGKDMMSQPVEIFPNDPLESQIYKNLTPLIAQSVVEAWKDDGLKSLYTVGLPSALGVGVQTYRQNDFLSKDVDVDIINLLTEKKAVAIDPDEESAKVLDIETGEQRTLTSSEYKTYYNTWVESIKTQLKDNLNEYSKMSIEEFEKEFKSVKVAATKASKRKVLGFDQSLASIRLGDETYKLSPAQIKERAAIVKKYLSENEAELRRDLKQGGLSEREIQNKLVSISGAYSKSIMVEKYFDEETGTLITGD